LSIVRSGLALLALTLVTGVAVAVAGDVRPLAQDPVFGLRYRTGAVHFEPFPATLQARCPSLTNARWNRELWIFAAADGFYVVGGFYVKATPDGGLTHYERDPQGVLLRIDDARCDLLGPARESFASRPEEVSPETLKHLSDDLAARYARAFGGTELFRRALHKQHVDPSQFKAPLGDALPR
jgi:hypothetical protein